MPSAYIEGSMVKTMVSPRLCLKQGPNRLDWCDQYQLTKRGGNKAMTLVKSSCIVVDGVYDHAAHACDVRNGQTAL